MNIILALTEKYAAICMNPPYMGSGRFDEVLGKYVKDNYAEAKADLATVFIELAGQHTAVMVNTLLSFPRHGCSLVLLKDCAKILLPIKA